MNTTSSTKLLLDSGDPVEYKEISELAKKNGTEIWGSTTNPSLIAKKLAGQKISQQKAFKLQKQIALEILALVPGAVSAEVYADEQTRAEQMIEQGRDIATWHERIVVKLPTTIEGFKARTALREEKIPINNTLVFSQQQIFAICLHEDILQNQYGPIEDKYPPFISPFLGRLDDIGENGIDLLVHGMKIKSLVKSKLWMLEASVRSATHLQKGFEVESELITAPAKALREWFALSIEERNKPSQSQNLKPIPYWQPSQELLNISSVEDLMSAMESGTLDITHQLTDKGLIRFASDWKAILISQF